MTQPAREQLGKLGIQLVAETQSYSVFARENLIILVERRDTEFGTIGSTGVLTDHGLAYLVWRDGQAFLKSKAREIVADEEQVAALRRFSEDLASALR